MKIATVVLSLLCPVLSAQSHKAVLDVYGVKLRLGMSKAEATEKLGDVEISKINENYWVVGATKDLGPSLQFTNGRLTYADRRWATHDNDIAEALFGVVNSLNQEGFSTCTVTAGTKSSPELTADNIWLRCGEKSIAVTRRSFGGKSYNSVVEQLGVMHDP